MKKRVFPILTLFLWASVGCTGTSDTTSTDTDADSDTDSDSDTDTDTDTDSDSDTDTDSDTDSDSDTDADTDSDTDTDSDGDCPGYPQGPYEWWYESVVPLHDFPVQWGPDGEEEILNTCDIWNNRETIKSVVMVFGSTD